MLQEIGHTGGENFGLPCNISQPSAKCWSGEKGLGTRPTTPRPSEDLKTPLDAPLHRPPLRRIQQGQVLLRLGLRERGGKSGLLELGLWVGDGLDWGWGGWRLNGRRGRGEVDVRGRLGAVRRVGRELGMNCLVVFSWFR